jgi:hypothetical protein
MRTKFLSENMKERDHLPDLSLGNSILEWTLKEIECDTGEWIQLAQDKV